MEERLQKYMASCGVASRRKCEEFILEGRVKINGVVVNELGRKVLVDKDIVEYINKKYQFSDETQEWIDFYKSLSDSEKASISYIPNELIEAINQGYIFYIK